jgi:hypothetical protein
MGIDAVDIGGAAKAGVPNLGAFRNADGENDDEGERMTEPVARNVDVPISVQKAVAPGATVAYPEQHPAASSGLPQDAGGAIIVGRGQSLTPKSVVTTERKRQDSEQKLNELLAVELEAEKPATIARSAEGIPVIEVVFNTSLGAIVSYFNKVVQSGNWLVLVSDNKAPASQKFIPKPVENPDGTHMVFDLAITGADKHTQRVKAMPLGIQFTVDDYDFVVMMLQGNEES